MPAKPRREDFFEQRRRKFIKPLTYETKIDTWSSDPEDSESDYESDSSGNELNCNSGWESPSPSDGKLKRSKQTNQEVSIQYRPCPDGHKMWNQSIPQELLVKIFSMAMDEKGAIPFVTRVSGVCRSWRSAASDSALWRQVDLSKLKIKQNSRTLRWLVDHRLFWVTDLNLSWWRKLKFEDFRYLFDSCRQLQTLNLEYCKLTPGAVKAMSSLPNLQNLNLRGMPDAIMKPSVICPLLQSLGKRLRELNLSSNRIKGCDAIMNALMNNCPNLTIMDFSACEYSSEEVLDIEKLQKCCPKLRILRLHNSKLPAVEADEESKVASSGFPHLEELNVAVTERMFLGLASVFTYDDDFIVRVLKNSPHLRVLDVKMCIDISDDSLLKISAERLTNLRVSHCLDTGTYSGIDEIINKWKHSLEYVDLSWNYYTSGSLDRALELMGQHGTPVRSLNLARTKVSRGAIRNLLTGCRQLTTLDLTRCRGRELPQESKRCHEGREELDELLKTLS